MFDAIFCQFDQLWIGDESRWTTRHLARFITEGGDVGVVVTHFLGNYNVTDFQN
ncbi:hypothetical protein D3C84_1162110 [compost metagenome]